MKAITFWNKVSSQMLRKNMNKELNLLMENKVKVQKVSLKYWEWMPHKQILRLSNIKRQLNLRHKFWKKILTMSKLFTEEVYLTWLTKILISQKYLFFKLDRYRKTYSSWSKQCWCQARTCQNFTSKKIGCWERKESIWRYVCKKWTLWR